MITQCRKLTNTFVEVGIAQVATWSHEETLKLVHLIADEDCLDLLLAKYVYRNADMFKRIAKKLDSDKTYNSCRNKFKSLKCRFKSEKRLEQKTGLFVAFHCWESVDRSYSR